MLGLVFLYLQSLIISYGLFLKSHLTESVLIFSYFFYLFDNSLPFQTPI